MVHLVSEECNVAELGAPVGNVGVRLARMFFVTEGRRERRNKPCRNGRTAHRETSTVPRALLAFVVKTRAEKLHALARCLFLEALEATLADARRQHAADGAQRAASKAPAAHRATSERLARSVRLLLAALQPLWPPGWTAS